MAGAKNQTAASVAAAVAAPVLRSYERKRSQLVIVQFQDGTRRFLPLHHGMPKKVRTYLEKIDMQGYPVVNVVEGDNSIGGPLMLGLILFILIVVLPIALFIF